MTKRNDTDGKPRKVQKRYYFNLQGIRRDQIKEASRYIYEVLTGIRDYDTGKLLKDKDTTTTSEES